MGADGGHGPKAGHPMNGWHEELDRRCTGTNRAGERCARAPIVGGTVCSLHGGCSPNAQAAAKTRLLAMVEPVLGVFEDILAIWHTTRCTGCGHVDANGVKCTGCGKPTGDPAPVIRVGQLVLDRAGFHPSLTIQQAPPQPNEFEHMTPEELEQRALHLLETVRSLKHSDLGPPGPDDGEPRLLPEATDGVLIDEDEPLPEPETLWSIPLVDITKEPESD